MITTVQTDRERAIEALYSLAPHHADDRDTWLTVGMCLHAVDSGLLEHWDRWSQQSEKYRPGECARQWRGFKSDGGLGLGTLLHMAGGGVGASAGRPLSGAAKRPKQAFPTRDAAIGSMERTIDGEMVGEWPYHRGDGAVAFYVVRLETGDGEKEFRPVHETDDGWVVADPPGLLPLYRVTELAGASRGFLGEGEKAADALRSIGLTATTSAHGCQAAAKSDWQPLAGKEVIILPDADEPGQKYADAVATILSRLQPAVTIKKIDLPGLSEGEDAVEYIAARRREGLDAEAIRREIEALADGADSFPAPIDPGLSRNEFPAPIPASQLGGGDEVDWLWEFYLARGYTTLLTGLWKSGKTTLVSHLLKAMNHGGTLGTDVQPCRVLVVTEEGHGLWARRRDELHFGDNVHFHIRLFKGRPVTDQWQALVIDCAERVRDGQFDLVIFDTFASVSPCDNENDAAKMGSALSVLHHITEAGGCVLLIHHPRKGDGDEGQASRGSGALPAFVDVILEFRRMDKARRDDRRRVLTAYSRFDETPDEIAMELGDDGYKFLGTKTEANQSERLAAIADMLAANPDGLKADDVHSQWDEETHARAGNRTLRRDLEVGFEEGRWRRLGKGTRNDPYLYAPNLEPDSFPASAGSIEAGNELETTTDASDPADRAQEGGAP